MIQELTYFASILICISLGRCYREIEEPSMKKNYGAGLGILTALFICGLQIYHSALMVWGNIVIIKFCNRRHIHKFCLAYTWAYLLFLHLHLQNAQYMIWLHQTMALRLVGLAFEVYTYKNPNDPRMSTFIVPELDGLKSVPDTADIITYAYFFIGLHKGPYYSMKVFQEHFTLPFSAIGDCWEITEQKLRKSILCSLGILIIKAKYPPKTYRDDDFYINYPADYRFLYNIPYLIMYVLQSQVSMMLCTSVATEAGFGVYPASTNPHPGAGPLKPRLSTSKPQSISEQEYNFAMLKCFDNGKVLFGPRMQDTIRGWNMPTRYWFWHYIYMNNNKTDKEVRGILTFLAWTLWCGPRLQQFILVLTIYLHIYVEKEYTRLCNTEGSLKTAWTVGFSIMRMCGLIYLTPCFVIEDYYLLLKYYYSIFWAHHILLVILIMGAIAISKANRQAI